MAILLNSWHVFTGIWNRKRPCPSSSSIENSSSEDLIPPEPIAGGEDDQFRHDDIANRLAVLVNSTETATNIALYGAWGTGKTGISALLENILTSLNHDASQPRRFRYFRFDAFKYAGHPLHRHFISALATHLVGPKKARRYTNPLYSEQTGSRPNIGAILTFVTTAAAGFLAILAGWSALNWFTTSSPRPDININYVASLLRESSSVVAVLSFLTPGLVALLKLASGIQITTKRVRPDSDEHFEHIFRKLLKTIYKRPRWIFGHRDVWLVVFVDELDRCSPREVVETLDVIRTYMDVEKCVFVVAADRDVLELSLSKLIGPNIPSFSTAPEYSSGTEYLNKIFHYQLHLPKTTPARITNYAIQLVSGREGVWSELINLETVVSTLIPSYVDSPRRAKSLLNSFSVYYRLIEVRIAEHYVTGPVSERATEIAKLVCLQMEFPNFFEAIKKDVRVTDILLKLIKGGEYDELAAEFPEHVVDLAVQFFRHENIDVNGSLKVYTGDTAMPAEPNELGARRNQQLFAYLEKTARVKSPTRDLVHMHGVGQLYGLDPADADHAEDLARDGRSKELLSFVNSTRDLPFDQHVEMLVDRIRFAFGLEETNIQVAILNLCEAYDLSVRAATLATPIAIRFLAARGNEASEHLKTFFRISAFSEDEQGSTLFKHATRLFGQIEDPQARLETRETVWTIATDLIRIAASGNDAFKFLAQRLTEEESERAAELLNGISAEVSVANARKLTTSLATIAEARLAKPSPVTETDGNEETHPYIINWLVTIAKRLLDYARVNLAEVLATAVLRSAVANENWRLAESMLALFDKLTSDDAITLLKQLIPIADTATRALWLARLGELDLQKSEDVALLDSQVSSAVSDIIAGMDCDATKALLAELYRLDSAQRTPPSLADVASLGKQLAAVATYNVPEAYKRSTTLHTQVRGPYSNVAEACAGSTLAAMSSLSHDFTELSRADLGILDNFLELHIYRACDEAIFGLNNPSDWSIALPEPDLLILDMRVLHNAAERRHSLRRVRPRISPSKLLERSVHDGQFVADKFETAFALWMDTFRVTTSDFRAVLSRWRNRPFIRPSLNRTFRKYNEERLNPTKRLELISPWLEPSGSLGISASLARAACVDLTDPTKFVEKLVDRFNLASNNDERAIIFNWWRHAHVKNTDAITLFVDKIYLPTVKLGNVGAFSIARKTLDTLSKNAGGRKREISKLTLSFAPSKQESKRAKKALKKNGFNVPKKWIVF